MLTGIAAIVTALAGLLAALVQAGFVGPDRTRPPPDRPAPQVAPGGGRTGSEGGQTGGSVPRGAPPPSDPQARLQHAPTTPGAGSPSLLVLRQPLDLEAFKVEVLDVQRSATAGGGTRIRVFYRVTAGERRVIRYLPEFIRIVADGVPRSVSDTRLRHSGQWLSNLDVQPETALDLVSEFHIPDATDDVVLRFSNGLRGAVGEVRLPPA